MKQKHMSVKEILEYARWFELQMDAKMVQLERLKDLEQSVLSLGCMEESEHFGESQDGVLEKIGKMAEQLFGEMLDLLDIRIRLMHLIGTLGHLRQQTVMVRRYLLNEEWSCIAEDLECSEEEVHQLHEKALKNLKKTNKQ